jgi:hypothetical protein
MVDFNEYDPDLEQINTLVNGLILIYISIQINAFNSLLTAISSVLCAYRLY